MFEKNVLSYEKNSDAGVCPICKEKLIAEIIRTPNRKSLNISCPKCKKSEFYTGAYKPGKEEE